MRTAVLSLLILAGFHGPATAQTTAWADRLFAGDLVHDFGIVPRGTQLKYTFNMTNIYKVPLEISDISVGCNCVTVKESTKLVSPGESATLSINMDGTRFTGPKTVLVRVSVSNPEYRSTA